jgi:hypothetical protein
MADLPAEGVLEDGPFAGELVEVPVWRGQRLGHLHVRRDDAGQLVVLAWSDDEAATAAALAEHVWESYTVVPMSGRSRYVWVGTYPH